MTKMQTKCGILGAMGLFATDVDEGEKATTWPLAHNLP